MLNPTDNKLKLPQGSHLSVFHHNDDEDAIDRAALVTQFTLTATSCRSFSHQGFLGLEGVVKLNFV